MKLIFFLSSIFLLSSSIFYAQSGGTDKLRGFGGPSFVNTVLAGEWTMEIGGLGGAFVSKRLYLGGGGFGLTQKIDNYEYDMRYGGLMLGYLWQGGERTGLNFYVFSAYGSLEEKGELLENNSDGYWAIRPAAEIDFLLTDWLRLGIGGGYRWTAGANISTLQDSDISASFGSVTLRFGNWGK